MAKARVVTPETMARLIAEKKVPRHYAVPKADGHDAVQAWIRLLPAWQSDRAARIDAIVTKARGRRKGLLVADMDSTIVQNETLDELAAIETANMGMPVGNSRWCANAVSDALHYFAGAVDKSVAVRVAHHLDRLLTAQLIRGNRRNSCTTR